ncbi:AAA family ATPase [Clostridium perfringens]|uniref:AAA family ATPase n=1 Tax=Clostridium perfringens TaxID=1502 RepID=UPI001459DDCB|nr:AAA family ATPase [Clostridium perfringens]MBI5987837.1 AAA family ATPase [Clostridium perfringens]MBI5995264.1 AAA family ATPase [Clostridium perfringens]MBI6076673.1 AAA family ATPase [Clostridium perfringens]MDU5883876.1 AAA family ATPase [Clostridium perfringens]MDZ5005830.1 AAA family ATPase [Clostridium perfringens]
MEIKILIGLPGSGKSTYCETVKNKQDVILATDDIREELFGETFSDRIKAKVFKELINRSIRALQKNKNLIIDTTFLNEKDYRNIFLREVSAVNKNLIKKAICFNTNIEKCIYRDKLREKKRFVGETIIYELSKHLVWPNNSENFDEIKFINN